MYFGHGFTHSDVYNMPVYLRNFYYNELSETKKEENEAAKKSNQKRRKVNRSNIPRNPRFK